MDKIITISREYGAGGHSIGQQVAKELGISVNTVKSHIRRHPVIPGTLPCVCCGKPVLQKTGRKAKKYCSDRCRITYWNHRYREDTDGKQ